MNNVLQLLTKQGHDGFAEGLRLLVNVKGSVLTIDNEPRSVQKAISYQ